jgi:hypothetical protein
MSVRAQQSAVWRRRIVRWLNACESKLPEPAFLKGEFPEWVQRLGRELMRTLLPEAKLKVDPEWSARELGAVIGHQLAYCHTLDELPGVPTSRVFRKLDKKTRERAVKQIKRFTECWALSVQRSLALAASQSYPETVEFFTAFAKALNRKPTDADASNFHRSTTRIYWIMLLGWRSVERLRSVRELQQGLCRYLDSYVVGDVKRVEKMCQRLGLRFGPRGRPTKNVGRL